MYTDCRSKKVVFICHCILNQNSISDGTAVYPAAFKSVIMRLMEENIGIVQMPCPELCCLGLDRGDSAGADRYVTVENTRIRRAMEKGEPYDKLKQLADHVIYQIDQYHNAGFQIVGIIGVNRSPNCGVETTSDMDKEIEGKGLFIEELNARIKDHGYDIPIIGIKTGDAEEKINLLLASSKDLRYIEPQC